MACSSSNTNAACANCACGAKAGGPSQASAVKLASRNKSESTPLLWSTTTTTTTADASDATHANYQATAPAVASSSASTLSASHDCPSSANQPHDPSFVCCRDVVAADERTLIDPDFARDCIVGLSDGLTVPFALTAGLSSTGSTKLVVLAGLAELVSGAISMGIGGFLSAQAELSHFAFNLNATQQRVERSCQSEVQRQVHDILKRYGIATHTSAQIAAELTAKEHARKHAQQIARAQSLHASSAARRKIFGCIPLPGSSSSSPPSSASSLPIQKRVASDEESQQPLVHSDDGDGDDDDDLDQAGLTPFLLKLGDGLEPVSTSRLYVSALTIGLSYFFGGIIPLLPYMFVEQASRALLLSVIITGVILLIFGVVKQRVTGGEGGVKGYAYGALSTLAVGGVAAGASWLIVGLLEGGSDAGNI